MKYKYTYFLDENDYRYYLFKRTGLLTWKMIMTNTKDTPYTFHLSVMDLQSNKHKLLTDKEYKWWLINKI